MSSNTDPGAPMATGDPTATPTGEPRTFTQEELDRIVGERLSRERDKYKDFDALREKAEKFDELTEAQKTELQKAIDERDKYRGEIEPTKLENLRLRVAISKQLPVALVDRLRGNTQEELEADADELLNLVPASNGAPAARGGHDGGPRGTATTTGPTNDMDAQIRQQAGYPS